jgi:hypothetical protein
MELLHGYGSTPNNTILEQIVDNYVVSSDGNLNVGDLCEFINGQVRKTSYAGGTSSPTQINSTYCSGITSVALDSTHILVTYIASPNNYLYSVVLTVSGTTIAVGTPVQVNSYGSSYICVTKLSSSQVVISYASSYLYSQVLTISGTSISVGAITQTYAGGATWVTNTTLDATHVLVSFQDTSSGSYLSSQLLIISGSTIITSAFTQITGIVPQYISCATLDSTHVLVSYMNAGTTGYYLWTVVLSINGTTLTVGTPVQVNSICTVYTSCVTLDSTHVLVSYQNNTTGSYLWSVVLIISGTTISVGALYQVNSVASQFITSVALDSTHVLVSYCNGSVYGYLYSQVLTISGTSISIGALYQVNSTNVNFIFPVLLSPTEVGISYINTTSVTYYLWSTILGISGNTVSNTIVSHALSPNVISLGAKNAGSTSQFGIKGIFSGLSGLTPSMTYYCDNNGNLTITVTSIRIGVALSSTDLLIDKAWWER